ncbi:MAG: hypothetical protein SGBAC_001045 [Bacillariaceae sp.]
MGHSSFILVAMSYAVDDYMHLRLIAIAGSSAMLVFTYFHPHGRILWLPFKWNALFILINAYRILKVYTDRFFALDKLDDLMLYMHDHYFYVMDIIDFAELIQLGTRETFKYGDVVVTQGEDNRYVRLVLKGDLNVKRDGITTYLMHQGNFVSESGLHVGLLLRGNVNSCCTVIANSDNVEVICWDRTELMYLMEYNIKIRRALKAVMSWDIVSKLKSQRSMLASGVVKDPEEWTNKRRQQTVHRYKGILKNILAHPAYMKKRKEELVKYRDIHHIEEAEHVQALKEMGWTLAEFDAGKKEGQIDEDLAEPHPHDWKAYFYQLYERLEKNKRSELRKQHSVKTATFEYTVQSIASAEVPLEPLDFESLGIVGRDEEITTLKACLRRMLSTEQDGEPNAKELVLIGGSSGTGKSMLVCTLANEAAQMRNSMFVQGKFDMNTSNEPYSGVAKVFNEICREIKDSHEDVIRRVREGIEWDLGEEATLLVDLVPELKDLINHETTDKNLENIGVDQIERRLERLRFAFRVLMRVFSAAFSPMLISFDDLQWADISSLQILDFLISDTRNENGLMILASYRSEEVDENSLLHQKSVVLREKAIKHNFHLTEMTIQPFEMHNIKNVITTLFSSADTKQTESLAELCLKRTIGNPFFVMEFLKTLHQEGLFRLDASSKSWTWDVNEIEAATMSTANVVDILQEKLTKLPQQQKALLQCVAYLGSQFSESTIHLIWGAYGRRLVESRVEGSSSLLNAIVKESIWEKCDGNNYRWIHDKLQEAALSLTGKQRESFQLDIGRTLYYGLDKQQVEDELFAIVDLINSGNVLRLTEFAVANLRAAEKARGLSAYTSASKYAAHGIDLLPDNRWSGIRSVTLKLYIMAAEMEKMIGNVEAADQYSGEVLSQEDLSSMETLPLKMLKADIAGDDLKFEVSMAHYIQMLRELGCRLTWTTGFVQVQALSKLMRTVKKAKAKPKGFYDAMVAMDDPKKTAIVSLISKVITCSFAAGDMFMNLLCVCKLVDMTLDFGINECSAKSFAALANAVMFAMQDLETATKFNLIALSMLQKYRGMHHSETSFLVYVHGLSWVRRLEDSIEPQRETVTIGMRMGDTDFALWNAVSHLIITPFLIGKPTIYSIISECSRLCLLCEDATQKPQVRTISLLWQMLCIISDASCPNPTELEGEIFSVSEDPEINPLHQSSVHFAVGEITFWNADYEVTAERALQVGERFNKLNPNNSPSMLEMFHRAVALYEAARRTKKRKFRVEAKKLATKIEKSLKRGNPNVTYYHLFLTAEQMALNKMYDMAEQKYEEALEMVTRDGHMHHIGLLNERYADYLMDVRSRVEESKDRLKEAIRHYNDWGAVHKVKLLESRL